jgi:hypothetical protein
VDVSRGVLAESRGSARDDTKPRQLRSGVSRRFPHKRERVILLFRFFVTISCNN